MSLAEIRQLFFFPVAAIVKRIQRSRLRRVMRGYKALKASGRLNSVAAVKQALTEHVLNTSAKGLSSHILGAGYVSGELALRQYLLARIGGIRLNQALLLAAQKKGARVVFPLPSDWREIVSRHGFEVAKFKSALLWHLYSFYLLLVGVLKVASILRSGFREVKRVGGNSVPYVFFSDLDTANLPHQLQGGGTYDVISWYLQWEGRLKEISEIHHCVPDSNLITIGAINVVPRRAPLPELISCKCAVSFLWWAAGAIATAAFDLLRGRYWHAVLLNQGAMAAQARVVPRDQLAKEYLFNNTIVYRPLWTYEAEARGSRISFYFYSTNNEPFKLADGYPPMRWSWKAMNWPRYLVWNDFQADFVRRAVGSNANLAVVGNIWFQGGAVDMPKLPPRCIAVFDVQPVRESYYRTLALPDINYYTPQTAIRFLEDIQCVLREKNLRLVLKRKRKINRLSHPIYRRYLGVLEKASNFIEVAPDIAALRLIESCVAVISMPYTSTALLGAGAGRPSIYYDPTGLLQFDDRAAHGIRLISGKAELIKWLETIETKIV